MDLTNLLPKSERVVVGEQVLMMREPSIQQTARILAVVRLLDLEAIAGPLTRLFGAQVVDEDSEEFVAPLTVLERIREVGPDLIAAAKPILGSQIGPAIQGAAVACIDSRATRRALIASQVLDANSPEDVDNDGIFLGCPAVRAWASEEMTPRQATAIIASAVEMMDFGGAAGNLLGAIMVEAPQTDPTADLQ